jgi:hypothetical protein
MLTCHECSTQWASPLPSGLAYYVADGLDFCTEICRKKYEHRRHPEPGEKHDQGKARYDLLPFKALEEVVLVLTFGANKYAPDGWRQVPNHKPRYFAACLRHLVAWFFKGEIRDPESGLHHLAHAACCVLFMLELDPEL